MTVRSLAKFGRRRPELGKRLRGRTGWPEFDRGATATEYALMVGFIAVVIVAAVATFGENVSALFIVPAGTF